MRAEELFGVAAENLNFKPRHSPGFQSKGAAGGPSSSFAATRPAFYALIRRPPHAQKAFSHRTVQTKTRTFAFLPILLLSSSVIFLYKKNTSIICSYVHCCCCLLLLCILRIYCCIYGV